WTTTATPNIPSELVVLSDKTALIRAENLVPLYRRNELNERQVLALNEVAGVLDTGSLADMRRLVAEGKDPGRVANTWRAAHPLCRCPLFAERAGLHADTPQSACTLRTLAAAERDASAPRLRLYSLLTANLVDGDRLSALTGLGASAGPAR